MRVVKRSILAFLALVASGAMSWAQEAGSLAGLKPLSPPVKLTLGLGRAAHHSPIIGVKDVLKPLGVDLEIVDFSRYADARTAIATGSLDVSTVAAGDLAVLLSQEVKTVVAVRGIATSKKFPIVRNGVTLASWQDLPKVKVGVPPGSAVWFQFIAKLQEVGLRYDQLKVVNIQGAGANFVQALQRGDVDAFIHSEPFETTPVLEKFGGPATALDYSDTKAVGSELGLFVATKKALADKREAIRRFFLAYAANEQALNASPDKFAEAVQAYFGVDAETAKIVAGKIKLGGVSDKDSLARIAKFLFESGVIQKDVSGEVPNYVDDGLLKAASN
jgi:sulfonate transport system substrate-binding protein